MKKVLSIIVDSIIYGLLFKLIVSITSLTYIDLLIGVCAYLLARINYIEDTTKDN